jgi:hypothetical protein
MQTVKAHTENWRITDEGSDGAGRAPLISGNNVNSPILTACRTHLRDNDYYDKSKGIS